MLRDILSVKTELKTKVEKGKKFFPVFILTNKLVYTDKSIRTKASLRDIFAKNWLSISYKYRKENSK